jgi:FtsH-binding integral membrane protein
LKYEPAEGRRADIPGEISMPENPASPPIESIGAKLSGVEIDVGLRQFLISVYNYMGFGLVLTGLVAYFAAQSGLYESLVKTPVLLWGLMLSPLALVLFLSFRIEKISVVAAQAAFWGYAGLVGLSLAGIFIIYTGESIARTFFITAATFLAMSLYGYMTRTDLALIGSFLLMGLFGITIASLVNTFLESSALQLGISVIGVFVFVGLTAYDTQRLKEVYLVGDNAVIASKKAIIGALTLYLDFLNFFLLILQLTGDRRR